MTKIAVVTAKQEHFERWLEDKDNKEDYILVNRLRKAHGYRFTEVVYLKGWWRMKNASEIEDHLNNRLKNK